MARLRTNFVSGFINNNPLLIGGTTLNSTALAGLEVVSGSDYAIITIDPDRRYGAPEIVYVTAHTSSATSGTILRAQEGTTAREHVLGTRWIHGPVEDDWDHGNLTGLSDDDHTIYLLATGSRNVTGDQSFRRSASTNRSINVAVTGDTQPRLEIRADGFLTWGPGGSSAVDTNLYRSAADTLKTDDNFSVGGGTIYIGSDTSIYRTGADSLQTDDALRVNSTLRVDGKGTFSVSSSTSAALSAKVTTDAVDRFGINASGTHTWGDGTNAADTNLYRSAADTLKTDDTLIVSRLDIGTNTYAGCPVGMVGYTAGSSAPSGWLLADGSAVSRSTYAALWALIGTTYGSGDGVNTFNLPNVAQKYIRAKGGSLTLNQQSTKTLSISGNSGSTTVSGTTNAQSISHYHDYYWGTSGVKGTAYSDNIHGHTFNAGSHFHSISLSSEAIPDIVLNAIIKF